MKRLAFLLPLFAAVSFSAPASAGIGGCPNRAADIERHIQKEQANLAKAISRGDANKAAIITAQIVALQLQRAALPC